MGNNIELLKECLEKRNPVLYVGAGFTYKSVNKKGLSIPLAQGLCELIFDFFWGEEAKKAGRFKELAPFEKFAKEQVNNCNLKDICQLLRQKKLLDERNDFLTDLFSGCTVSHEDIRNVICEYSWSKIFTVNIDDLIENIYAANSKKINVWNNDNDDKKHSMDYPTLIKLHGCVNNPNYGYVFDNTEYNSFLTNENYIITEFGDAFSKNDIIFIGTEFQENDLKHIIEKYANIGYDASTVNDYFFVTPTINDELTRMEIEESSNMHHIAMTAEEFFKFVKEKIQVNNEILNKLKETGLVSIYDVYRNLPTSYVSKLYHGSDICYSDLRDNWDITYSYSELVDWVNTDNSNKLIALYGNEYVGKTCIAKRILYNFFILGYECYEYKLDSTEKIESFIRYVSNVEKNIAVLFEGAAYLYELIVRKVINDNPLRNRIVIITTDSLYNHKKKYHSLKNDYCKILSVNEKIDNNRADLIYNKLDEKHSLSRLLDLGSSDEIKKFMISNNDIIDVLYYSSLGRNFEDHINTYILSDLDQDEILKKQISILCMLNQMGIIYVPATIFSKASKIIFSNYNKAIFERKINKILQIDKEYYHLRYMRFLSSAFFSALTDTEKESIIISLIKYVSGRFNEGEYNELSSILYKLLNLKSLQLILSATKIKELYQNVETNCKEYSYYWVQRGICAQKQKNPDYEEADRFLREAKRIRPESYQVAHAVAKNLIERGLHSSNEEGVNQSYFSEGIQQMQLLIENRKYSQAFSYSLHAYIDSWLKFCRLTDFTLSDEICNTINYYVSELDHSEIDPILSNIFYRLKIYAYKNGLSRKMENISGEYWDVSEPERDFENEYIENDWII